MLVVIFHSTARLSLWDNSLTGSIPSEITLLTNLCESRVVWLLVVTIVVSVIVISCSSSLFMLQIRCLSGAIFWRGVFQARLDSLLNWVSLVWFGCLSWWLVSCFPWYSQCVSSFFIRQLTWILPWIVWGEWFQVKLDSLRNWVSLVWFVCLLWRLVSCVSL